MLFFRSLSSLFCCCVVSVVIVRDCRSMQVDLNANLQNSHSHKDLDRTVVDAAAALDVVDTEQLLRLLVISRMHSTNTDDAAEVEKTEGDQQITGKGRTGGLEEEEDDEEEEEEWLPVFNGGKQKLNGEEEHRDEKRVKRDGGGGSDGKDSSLQEKDAIDGRLQSQHQHQQQQQQHQQQYTTLHTRNDNDDETADEVHGEAGSDAVDHTPEEDKEESDDRSTEVAAKDSDDATEDGSEEETGKEGETVKERDGEVNAEDEASIDDEVEEEEEEEDEEEEDEASSKEKIAEADGEQKRKETSEEDPSERDDLPTEDDTKKQDDVLDEDDTKKQDDVLDEDDTNKQDDVSEEDDTNKQDDGLDEDDTQKKPVTSEVEEETEEMTDDPDKDDQTAKEEEEEDDDDEDEERKDSMNTRRTGSETMTQKEDEDDGGSDEHLTNSGVSKEEDKESKGEDKESKGEDKESKGEDKESKGEDKELKGKDKESTGSGDEKDEKVDFISDHLDRADDTSDESQAATGKDDESAEETDDVDATALATDDDDDDKEEGAEDEDEEDEGEAKEELASTTAKEKDADEDSEKLSLPINEDKDDNGRDESDKFADEGSGDLEVEQNIEPRTGGEHEPDNPDNAGDEDGKDGEATKEQSIRRRGDWRYYGAHGPGNWSKEFSGCESSSSRFQSPISIAPEQTHLNDTLQAIDLTPKHSEKKCNSVLFNDAKTVKVIFEHMSIRVKVDDRFYKVAWVQFHWGDTKDTGSEHVIAGRRFPLEMQVVCYDEENFPDVMETEWVADNASSSKIIILATLFEISDADNPLLSSIVGNLNSIHSPGQNVSIPTLNLKGLHPKTDYFYRYSGSLTSPPCQGGVEWIVFKAHQTISLSQLSKFRQLHEEDFEDRNYTTIDYNWRPIQPLEEGQVVTRNFPIPPPNNDNKKTLKPSAVHASSSFSHRSPAIDIFYVCTCMHFVWKLFLV